MHRALRVPDILLIIFKNVTDDSGKPLLPTLAAIAGTCRLFQRQVEGILWYKLVSVSNLFNILPHRVRNRESRSWSLNRRIFSGADWMRFLDRASRIRVLVENTGTQAGHDPHEPCTAIFLAMAVLREPILLTPNLRTLEWQTSHASLGPAINLFISASLESLEIDAKLIINHVVRVPLADICPRLKHLKINGNARSAAGTISSILRRLHSLETIACSTLDHDAFVHLAQLKSLSYLAVDMRWSVLNLDALRDRLCSGSFLALETLCWKDYDLDALTDVFLMPDISPSNVHLEIESFCTPLSVRAFFRAFSAKFPHTRTFSLVHDIEAGRRFGLQAGTPGREHQLELCDLKPLLVLTSLRVLNLVDLGHLRLDDELIKTIASALPELEQLSVGRDAVTIPSCVTFDGLLSLLHYCPKLRSLEVCVDAEDVYLYRDTPVRHDHVTHLRLKGNILGARRTAVDELLRRILPGLQTVEESLDGVRWRVRDVSAREAKDGVSLGRGRRTRNAPERCSECMPRL